MSKFLKEFFRLPTKEEREMKEHLAENEHQKELMKEAELIHLAAKVFHLKAKNAKIEKELEESEFKRELRKRNPYINFNKLYE